MKKEISERLPLVEAEEVIGEATVLQEFMATGEGTRKKVPVAGCRCVKGELKRDAHCKLVRNGEVIYR